MTERWELCSIELDFNSMQIGRFFEEQKYPVKRVYPRKAKAAWSAAKEFDNVPLEVVEQLIAESASPDAKVLALMGHGGFHHLTYGLCRRADKISRGYGYIHIDNHNDHYGDAAARFINCGNFTGQIANFTNVQSSRNMVFIGSRMSLGQIFSRQCRAFIFRSINHRTHAGRSDSLERMLDSLPDDVYISTDLDIMHPSEVRTAYSRGEMRLDELLGMLSLIKQKKNIISADIAGYTTSDLPSSVYDGQRDMYGVRDEEEPCFEKSMAVYKAVVDELTGGAV